MKKGISILLSVLILLAGVHFSVAIHFCGGTMASAVYSTSGKLATCGMENENHSSNKDVEYTSDCCKNILTVFSVDNCQQTAVSLFSFNTSYFANSFCLPVWSLTKHFFISDNNNIKESPPGNYLISDVKLSVIRIFRI
jgi:hypothetical protein